MPQNQQVDSVNPPAQLSNVQQAVDSSPATADEINVDEVIGKVRRGSYIGVGWVVFVAIIVAAGLVALSFSVYDAKDEPKPLPQSNGSVETLDRSSPLDQATLDEEEGQIDQTIQDLDNNSDFSEAELSDETLGL